MKQNLSARVKLPVAQMFFLAGNATLFSGSKLTNIFRFLLI